MEEKKVYDTVIIGSGPAGLTAAIYNVRADLKTVVIAGSQPGGQLTITTTVENFPGFPKSIGGTKLMLDMMDQVKNLGGEIKYGMVKKISNFQFSNNSQNSEKKGFEVILEDGSVIEGGAVVVATGAQAKWLGMPKEKELMGRGISGCATCDGMLYRGKKVGVVGGGDVACEDAAFLANFTEKVILIHRRDQLRAQVPQQKKVLKNPKIEIWWNHEVKEIIGEGKLEKIRVVNNKSGEEKTVELDGLFVAVGHLPATKFVAGLVDLKENGRIMVGKNAQYPMMTSVPGIFAAGDCVDDIYEQAVIAAGDGARAGMDAERWLGEQRLKA